MTISAKVIADSISKEGKRITSLQLRYPRFIHAEFMTHRVFSRNASSSRAVPVKKLIEDIIADTAMPIHWGKNQAGMQANEECNEKVAIHHVDYSSFFTEHLINKEAWFKARDNAIIVAQAFSDAGYHKQIVNRLLEPFSHINVIVTSTEWDNFFELRRHKDAQPEIHELADRIWWVMENSFPNELELGQWHLPYIRKEDEEYVSTLVVGNAGFGPRELDEINNILIKLSVARCARVSYLTHDMKEPVFKDDLHLYDLLVGSVPLHASPAEHQATPDEKYNNGDEGWWNWFEHGNFVGWRQYRKMIEL